ncbi:DUF2199 domain-containing protein [Anderseniella sp. Alg231-50]|uniref:DUF2199 domain-containing protein n=1 Tax=Anderseniella sp. Alg231-50 TaxID=1922226 RepID=UPI00307C5C65
MLGRLFGRKTFRYRCHECGKWHSGSPSFSYKYPAYYFDVPEDERARLAEVTDDLCQIEPAPDEVDGATIYCIRVILEIPVIGLDEPFTWGVWVTQSQESFERYVETYDQDQSADGSFGWLAVNMPFYKDTGSEEFLTSLECDVPWGPPGKRPTVQLWECDHQLAVDQRNGISWDKAAAIANLANREFQRRE